MSKGAGILWSLLAIIVTHGIYSALSGHVQSPAQAATSIGSSVTTTNADQNTTGTPTATAATPTEKEKFEAELQKVKDGKLKLNPQQQLQFEKEAIQYDKAELLKMEPSVLDAGFAGNLFVQTDKNTTQQYKSVGNDVTFSQANGMYWVLPVTMNNAGMNPMTANDNMFSLVDTDGRTYAPDTKAEMALVNDKPLIMDTLNPDEDVTEYLVFDMPTSLKPSNVTLQVHNAFNNVELRIS